MKSANGANSEWRSSGKIDVSSPGDFQFLMENIDQTELRFFNVNISLKNGTIFLTVTEQEPYESLIQIQNCIPNYLLVVGTQEFPVKSNSKIPFAWTDSANSSKIPIKIIRNKEPATSIIYCSIDSIGKEVQEKVQFKSEPNITYHILYSTILERGARILKVYSKTLKEEGKIKDYGRWKLDIDIDKFGLSIITTAWKQKCELLHLQAKRNNFHIINQYETILIETVVGSIVVDNNLSGGPIFPLILFQSKPQNNFIQCSLTFKHSKKQSQVNYLF